VRDEFLADFQTGGGPSFCAPGYGVPPRGGRRGPPRAYGGPSYGYSGPSYGYGGPPYGYRGPPRGYGGPPRGTTSNRERSIGSRFKTATEDYMIQTVVGAALGGAGCVIM
jgi:hypothetical protein